MRFTRIAIATIAATGLLLQTADAQLTGVVTDNGQISISVDGLGAAGTGTLQVNKPAGATVRAAYMSAASNFDYVFTNTDVTLAGNNVTWTMSVFNGAGPSFPNFYNNVFADVTSIVKPIIDPLGAGLHNLTVTENGANTNLIDGTALMVVFNDPAVTGNNGVIVLFGGQATTGDQFIISTPTPLDPTAPGAFADMGLGISFSFQGTSGSAMISEIDVNGMRLTSSAGGEDDGAPANGALITVGGVGDTNANPAPFAPSTSFSTDDELYSLLPFVMTGDTQIIVDTLNPSDDDNIFFGYFFLNQPISVDPETIFLTPLAASASFLTNHTVTATVMNASTMTPIVGRNVNFNVVSGPNAGDSGSDSTDANGEATFTYFGDGGIGLDTLIADMINSAGNQQFSNTATVDWAECFLLLAKGRGNDPFDGGGYTYQTHLKNITASYAVTMEDNPTLVLPPPAFTGSFIQHYAIPKVFTAEVLMFNPQMFPNNPEQWSKTVDVWVMPDASVIHNSKGTQNGITLGVHATIDAQGNANVRMPFRIDGI